MNERLEEIGKRLGLSDNDIKEVRMEGRKYRTLFFLGGAILALIAFILGLLFGWFTKKESGGGGSNDPGSGYPYAGLALGSVGTMRFGRPTRAGLILASMAAFLAGLSAPVFGQSIDYGVYCK